MAKAHAAAPSAGVRKHSSRRIHGVEDGTPICERGEDAKRWSNLGATISDSPMTEPRWALRETTFILCETPRNYNSVTKRRDSASAGALRVSTTEDGDGIEMPRHFMVAAASGWTMYCGSE